MQKETFSLASSVVYLTVQCRKDTENSLHDTFFVLLPPLDLINRGNVAQNFFFVDVRNSQKKTSP